MIQKQDMQKQMQDPLDRVNRNISNAFDKPMENARKSVEAQTAAIKNAAIANIMRFIG